MARKPLDDSSPTTTLTLKLPQATVEAVDAVAGAGGRSAWIRDLIDKALSGRGAFRPAEHLVVPVGGQDAAAGKGVEERRDEGLTLEQAAAVRMAEPSKGCWHPRPGRIKETGKSTDRCNACGATGLERFSA